MRVESLLICEVGPPLPGPGHAVGFDENGLQFTSFRASVKFLTVAVRMRFGPREDGKHELRVRLVNSKGNNVGSASEFSITVPPGQEQFDTAVEITDVYFPSQGNFTLLLDVDGKTESERSLAVFA